MATSCSSSPFFYAYDNDFFCLFVFSITCCRLSYIYTYIQIIYIDNLFLVVQTKDRMILSLIIFENSIDSTTTTITTKKAKLQALKLAIHIFSFHLFFLFVIFILTCFLFSYIYIYVCVSRLT
jgi:hypothetical protein